MMWKIVKTMTKNCWEEFGHELSGFSVIFATHYEDNCQELLGKGHQRVEI